jgi:hypothetical protein
MPNAANNIIRLDPPEDINGSGTPVKGINAIFAAIFIAV